MNQNTSRKKQAKLRRKQKRRKMFRKVLFTGLFLGITASLCKALLLHALTQKENSQKTALIVQDYSKEFGAGETGPDISSDVSFRTVSGRDENGSPDKGSVHTDIREVIDTRAPLEDAETEEKLAELARQDKDIAEIYANKDLYPGELLKALASNQEMTEFVKGYLTADKEAAGGINTDEAKQAFPLFIQWDQRWGYVPYGKKSNIGISGCGPACMSMVIFTLTRDESATPDALAAFSVENGYYMEGEGTAWLFMKDAATAYGLNARELGLDEAVIRQYLDNGNPVICAMRPGDFTTSGHFIVIYGYDEKGLLINDPNSRERSSRHWDFEDIKWQIRNLWGYSR